MEKKVKTEIAIGIILLVAIIVGGIIWFTNKKQDQVSTQPITTSENTSSKVDTSDWKTFSNQVIDFNYPSMWTADATEMTPNGFSINLKEGNEAIGTVDFRVKSAISPNDLVSVEKSQEDLEKRQNSKIYNKNNLIIDGKNAIAYDSDFAYDGTNYYSSIVFIDAGDYIITGSFQSKEQAIQEKAHLFFHTFKLKDLSAPKPNVTSSNDISTWKTLNDEHLSFQYPPDWQTKSSALKDGSGNSVGTSSSPDQSLSFRFTASKLSTARQDIRDWYGFFKGTSGTISNERIIKIDSMEAKSFDDNSVAGKNTEIILQTPNYIYTFGASPNASDAFLLKIINSIKIISK